MAIPLSTTHVSVHRVFPDPTIDGQADGYASDPPAPRCIATRVRATVSPPSGSTRLVGGERIVYDTRAYLDPTDLQATDTITDEYDGTCWTVLNVRRIKTLGFDHMAASVREVEGASA